MTNESTGSHVVFWEDKKLDKIQLKKLGERVKEYSFPLPALLFKFLDGFLSLPKSLLLAQFHELLLQKDAEFIYIMLLRQIRNLIIAKDLGGKGFGTMPPWQFGKFITSCASRSIDDLVSIYRRLLYLDYQIKKGLTPFPMASLLDLFFVSL